MLSIVRARKIGPPQQKNVERKRAWLGEFRLFVRELEVNLRSNNSIGYQANRVRLGAPAAKALNAQGS